MNRRQVLALLGSAAGGGCLGGAGSDGPATTTRETETTEETSTTAPPDTTTETATPSAPELGEPSPERCPDYGVPRTVCSPDADTQMAMVPSAETVSLPSGSLSFTLENTTEVAFQANFYGWRLHKRVEAEWYFVAPAITPQPLHQLPPGESHTWDVTLSSSPPTCEATCPSSDRNVSVRGLGGGTYAFGVTGSFAEQDYEGWTGFVSRFELEGDPVSPSISDSVESVERDGDTVVVRMPAHDTAETVTVTRVEDPPEEPERVIAEQVLGHFPLRNALASFEEGVETVRVENVENPMTAVVRVDDRRYIEYEGETYRVDVEDETTD